MKRFIRILVALGISPFFVLVGMPFFVFMDYILTDRYQWYGSTAQDLLGDWLSLFRAPET